MYGLHLINLKKKLHSPSQNINIEDTLSWRRVQNLHGSLEKPCHMFMYNSENYSIFLNWNMFLFSLYRVSQKLPYIGEMNT